MRHKIYPAARRRLIEIWRYTDEAWGEAQADAYVRGIHAAIEAAAGKPTSWRPVEHPQLRDIFFVRRGKHFIFFRQLRDGALGVVSILHERMKLPDRLTDDLND